MNAVARLRARPRAGAWPPAAACLLLAFVLPQQFTNIDAASVADAVRIGQATAAETARFHSAYQVSVNDGAIRDLEVVTPFRRLVQLTEERVRLRDATWDQTRAATAARTFEGRLDLVLHLQFAPNNTYRTVPRYSLAIHDRRSAAVVPPLDTRAAASYLSGQPAPPGTPILGATVTSTFDAVNIDASAPILVGIFLDDREVRRVTVDLGVLR